MNRSAYQAILERQKDGKYIVALDTDDFHKLDTIPLTQAHVDTIRQMLIEGEVYKMPAFYDSPLLILDAPSGSVSVNSQMLPTVATTLHHSNGEGNV